MYDGNYFFFPVEFTLFINLNSIIASFTCVLVVVHGFMFCVNSGALYI